MPGGGRLTPRWGSRGDGAGFGRSQAGMLREFGVDPSLPSLHTLWGFQHQNRSRERLDLRISSPFKNRETLKHLK